MRLPTQLFPPRDPADSSHVLQLQQRLNGLSVRYEPFRVSINYTFTDTDEIDSLQVDATAAAVTITLPSPTGNRRRRIIKTDASVNTVTIAVAVAGQLINTAASWILSLRYDYIEVEPTGTGWIVIDGALGSIVGPGAFTTLSATALLNLSAVGAGQIKFPAAQNASADANTLDDYEEGTWTPVVAFGGASVGITYTSREGTYTKIGRLVHARCRIVLSSKGTSVGNAIVTGLPFAAAAVYFSGSVLGTSLDATVNAPTALVTASGTQIELYSAGAGTVAALMDTTLTNTTDLFINVTYHV